MASVRLPNGAIIQNVPDGATDDEIKTEAIRMGIAAESDFPQTTQAQPTQPTQTQALDPVDVPMPNETGMSPTEIIAGRSGGYDDTSASFDTGNMKEGAVSALQGFADTTTLGMGTDIGARINAGLDMLAEDDNKSFNQRYNERLQQARSTKQYLRDKFPDQFAQGEATGMGAQMIAPGGAITRTAVNATGKIATPVMKAKAKADALIKRGNVAIKDTIKNNKILRETLNTPNARGVGTGGFSKVQKMGRAAGELLPESTGDIAAYLVGGIGGPAGSLATGSMKRGASKLLELPLRQANYVQRVGLTDDFLKAGKSALPAKPPANMVGANDTAVKAILLTKKYGPDIANLAMSLSDVALLQLAKDDPELYKDVKAAKE